MGDFLTERRALTRIAEAMGVDDVMGAAVLAMAKRWKEDGCPVNVEEWYVMVQIEECQNEEEEARARLAEIMGRNERLSVQLDLLRSHGRDRS